METARIDIRKLQLLNDRIHQTLEALNQVRLTVHGLQTDGLHPGFPSHAYGASVGYPGAVSPFSGYGFGIPQQPFGMQPFGMQPFGMPHFGMQPYGYPFGWSQETPWSQVANQVPRGPMPDVARFAQVFPFSGTPTQVAVGF